jgi:acyl-ACP thioesterase
MQLPTVWETPFEVRAYEVDVDGRLAAPALCDWLQETAGQHAAALGWAVADLRPRSLTWVLSRLHVKVLRRPEWRERITVATWPSGVQRAFALRDFRAFDASSSPVAGATTAWLLLNLSTRRPVRPPRKVDELARSSPGRAVDDRFEKLPAVAASEPGVAFTARFSDLDVNRHVNNVVLVRWLVDGLPTELLAANALTELEVEFRSEVAWGDVVESSLEASDADPRCYAHVLLRRTDGREVARARTRWTPL